MLYSRKGLPEEDEIILCRVTKIFPNSVFVDLLEYHQQGMVHISEISPGRIRNLRDFVTVDREIVCKVLRIDRERGHIDLSLRRVNSHQRQEKMDQIKQELKAESVILNLAKKLKKPADKLYLQIATPVFKEYSHLYLCFRDIVDNKANLEKLGVEKSVADEISAAVIDKFKPEKIYLKGEIALQTYAPNGIGKIKSALAQVEAVSPTIRLFYVGAGKYKFVIEDLEYKPAEKKLEKIGQLLEKFNDKLSTASVQREKSE